MTTKKTCAWLWLCLLTIISSTKKQILQEVRHPQKLTFWPRSHESLLDDVSFRFGLKISGSTGSTAVHVSGHCTIVTPGSLYYQPKQSTIRKEIPKNHHRFAWFDPPQYGVPFNDLDLYVGVEFFGAPWSFAILPIKEYPMRNRHTSFCCLRSYRILKIQHENNHEGCISIKNIHIYYRYTSICICVYIFYIYMWNFVDLQQNYTEIWMYHWIHPVQSGEYILVYLHHRDF